VYGIGKNNIENAFKVLTTEEGELTLAKEEILNLLKNEGEQIT